MDTITFGEAIESLKKVNRIARAGWNGKGMFLYLNKGSIPVLAERCRYIEGISDHLFDLSDDGTSTVHLPNINMSTPSGSIVHGWLASQTDILSEDWIIVE